MKYSRDFPGHREQVAMEKRQCVLCDSKYDTGALLLDMRFRRVEGQMQPEGRLPRDGVVAGVGVCDSCKQEFTGMPLERYDHVCLVECDPDKITLMEKSWKDRDKGDMVDITKPIMRTGQIGFVSKKVWDELFNIPAPDHGLCFVEPGVVEHLATIPGADTVEVSDGDK